jgi:hypothetical protein
LFSGVDYEIRAGERSDTGAAGLVGVGMRTGK